MPTQSGEQGYQQQYEPQTSMGGQFQQTQFGGTVGQQFQQSVPAEVQQTVNDLEKFETVAEWAKSRAVERGSTQVAQRCDDLAQIAHLEKGLLIRQSPLAQPVGQATKQTIQQSIQELQHRTGDPEVQEALSHGQQVLGRIDQALQRIQTPGQFQSQY
jgi:hypothetical protein